MSDKPYKTLRYPSHLITAGDLINFLSTLDARDQLNDIKPRRGGKQLRYTGAMDIATLQSLLGGIAPGAKLYPDMLLHVCAFAEPKKEGALRRAINRIHFYHFGILALIVYLLIIHVYAAMYVSSIVLQSNAPVEDGVTTNDLPQNKATNEVFAPPVAAKTIEDTFRISYGNESAEKVLHVFIDPQCPFCRKMEPEISSLIKTGWHVIKYPVAVLGDKSAADVQTIFCSSTPGAVLSGIMAGAESASATCDRGRNAPAINTDFFLGLGLDRVPVVAYGTTGKFMVGFHTADEIESWAKTLKQ